MMAPDGYQADVMVLPDDSTIGKRIITREKSIARKELALQMLAISQEEDPDNDGLQHDAFLQHLPNEVTKQQLRLAASSNPRLMVVEIRQRHDCREVWFHRHHHFA